MTDSKHAIEPADVMDLVDLATELAYVAAGTAKTAVTVTAANTNTPGASSGGNQELAVEHSVLSMNGSLGTAAPLCQHAANPTIAMTLDQQLEFVWEKLGGWEIITATTKLLYDR
jgi:hypothetical protein